MPVTTQFGGADASLVAAATRAGLASAPPDYSKTFQAVADSYHKMVMSNAEIWGKVMFAAGTKIADEMKAHTDSAEQTETLETWMGSESGAEFKNWFQENNDAIQATFKRDKRKLIPNPKYDDTLPEGSDNLKEIKNKNYNKGGILSSMTKENKEIRAKLLKERNDRFADVQFNIDHLNAAKEFIDKGQVWGEATGIFGMEINNAAYATRRGQVTARGNYVVWEEDDRGKMKFTMYNDATKAESYDPNTNTIEDPFNEGERINLSTLGDDYYDTPRPVMRTNSVGGEEKIRHTGKEMLNMITLKPKEDSAGNSLLKKAMEKDFLSVLNLGGASKTGILTGTTKSRVNGIAEKYSDNPAAWHTKTWLGGEDNNSFFEEGTNPSGLTANLLNAANQHIDWKKILSGMTNVEGTSPGIDEADFAGGGAVARKNLLGLQSALFNPGSNYYKKEQTGKVFKDWVNNKLNGIFTEGYNAAQSVDGGGDELTKTLNNIVTSWKSGNISDLALPYGHKIYFDKDGEFGKNSYILETGSEIEKFDASKSLNLKKILMRYAGNSKSLQNSIENMDFDIISFGSVEKKENVDLKKDSKKKKKTNLKNILQYIKDYDVVNVRMPWEVKKTLARRVDNVWQVLRSPTSGPYPRKKAWRAATNNEIAKIKKKFK